VKREWAALIFAMCFPTVMSWVYFVGLAGGGRENQLAMFAYGVGKFVQFAFPIFYCLLFERDRFRPSLPTRRGLLLAVGFALFTNAVMFAVYWGWLRGTPLMGVASGQIVEKLREFQIDTPAGFVAFACFVSLAHSLMEEYYFRWFIFALLRRHLKLWAAIAVSSLAFMAHHVVVLAVYFPGATQFLLVVVPFSLAVAVGGAVWAWLYERSQSLYAPWISHLLIDAGIMVVGYDLVGMYLTR
jgi:membrane protease YdiL (CAAX protease family)